MELQVTLQMQEVMCKQELLTVTSLKSLSGMSGSEFKYKVYEMYLGVNVRFTKSAGSCLSEQLVIITRTCRAKIESMKDHNQGI